VTIDKSMLPEPFELSQGDKLNPLWIRMEQYWTNKLAMLRQNNDADLDSEETAKLRGRISEIKAMLALGKDRPIV
jgi:hypothetical protein